MTEMAHNTFEDEFYRLYEDRKPLYNIALTRVRDSLESILHDRARHTVAEQRRMRVEAGRVKEANRLLVKANLSKYENKVISPETVFTAITDIAGIRVTCNTYEDVRRIEHAILESRTLKLFRGTEPEKAHEDYLTEPKPSGYRAIHMLVEVDVPFGSEFVSIPCEIQIRTLLQHAWGELTHEDTFKTEIVVPPLVSSLSKRLATALAVLDEIAQDLRDELNKIEKGYAAIADSLIGTEDESIETGAYPDSNKLNDLFINIFGRPLNISKREIEQLEIELTRRDYSSIEKIETVFESVRKAVETSTAKTGVLMSDSKILTAIITVVRENSNADETTLRIAETEAHRLDELTRFLDAYVPGSVHMATITRVTPRYAIGQLGGTAQAILSVRHLEHGNSRISLEDFISPGETVRIEVISADPAERRIEARPIVGDSRG